MQQNNRCSQILLQKRFLKFTSQIYKENFRVVFVFSWWSLVHAVYFWNIKKLLQAEI